VRPWRICLPLTEPSLNALRRPLGGVAAASRLAPGLLIAISIAALSRWMTGHLPDVVAEVTVALLLGIAAAQVPWVSARVAAGARFATRWILRAGIVLLGARLSLDQIGAIGPPAVVVILATMTVAFLTVRYAARAFAVESRLAILLAVGAAVCGNSAVIATAPIIGARGRDMAYAVATVTLFGTVALLTYPILGQALGMSSAAFGLWVGVAIQDTSQVVAAGAAHSPAALDTATVVKLIRNALMAPLLVIIAWAWHRSSGPPSGTLRFGILQAVPLFVVGFLVLAALRSVGVIGTDQAQVLDAAARGLILIALAGLGLSLRVTDLLDTSLRPLAVGLSAAILVGGAALIAIQGLGLGQRLLPS
jgi:uncharacterized integral membrane protein (TIGR00698 family)